MNCRFALLTAYVSMVTSLAFAAPVPLAKLPNSPQDALINDTFHFCLTFQNSGNAVGFSPFVDFMVPIDPMTGNSACDGVTITNATLKSTNPNVPLTPIITGGCSSGAQTVTHPFGPLIPPVTLPPGMQLVTIELPFGSFQPAPEPALMIDVEAKIDHYADVDVPLSVRLRGGFRYSGITAPWTTTPWVTPRLIVLRNNYSGDDQETVAGPNFPQTYTITADIAPGQTINGLTIQDCLPPGVVWTSGAGGPCVSTIYGSVIGTGVNTISLPLGVTFDNTVIPALSCFTTVMNQAFISSGTWTPDDQLDPLVVLSPLQPPPANVTTTVLALAAQKNPSPPSQPTIPGSVITYDIAFQGSDYEQFGNLKITDTMSDGLAFVSASLTMTDKLGTISIPSLQPGKPQKNVKQKFQCPPPSLACTPPGAIPTGPIILASTRYVFDISVALVSAGHSGLLTGGLFPSTTSTIPAHGVLTIQAQVLDTYLYGTQGTVVKDDPLLNHADISGSSSAGLNCGNGADSCLAVPTDVIRKFVVGKNNAYITPTSLGGPSFMPGERVTFRVEKTIPSGDFKAMRIQEWFPGPGTQLSTLTLVTCGTFLPSTYCFSPLAPIATAQPGNSYLFDFMNHSATNNQPLPLKIETTHTISNVPAPDGMLETNVAQECELNTQGVRFCQSAIAQFRLQEPFLTIQKGVCAPNCGKLQKACPACPIGKKFTSTTVAAYLGSSLAYADAKDFVQFAIVVRNTGAAPAFDVQVSDQLPSGFQGHITSKPFCVQQSDGTTPPFTLNPSNPTTSFTISLGNPIGAAGSGTDVVLILYEVQLDPANVLTNGCYDNLGHIAHYASTPGGPDFVSAGYSGPDAKARLCIEPHNLYKWPATTSEVDPGAPNVTIGNVIHYTLAWTEPEGTSTFIVDDPLPPGIEMIGTATVTAIGFPTPPVVVGGTSAHPTFAFTNVLNPSDDTACETLMVEFNALVRNVASNANGQPKSNYFKIGTQTSNIVNVFVVEPALTVTKNVSTTGGVITFTITVTNSSSATAFDIKVKDTMASCLTAVPGSTSINVPSGVVATGTFPLFGIDRLKSGQVATISFNVTQTCKECAKLTNSVRVDWNTEPGPRGTANATPGASCSSNGERCYFKTASASLCGRICGVKYADLDGDHIQDPGEPTLSGWTVGVTGTPPATTDANGSYCIALMPGNYNLCEATKSGWTPTSAPCVSVAVTMNQTSTVDFSNKPECYAKLCGTKTTPGEQPVGGWTITATPAVPGQPIVTATTAADGSYCMTLFGAAGGAYTISEAPRTGWLQSQPPSGTYNVTVQCAAGTGTIGGVVNPMQFNFVNDNICANVKCPASQHCVVGTNSQPECTSDDKIE